LKNNSKELQKIVWSIEGAIQQTSMTERIALLPTIIGGREDKCDAEFDRFSYILRTLLIDSFAGRWMGSRR
jgi:hypothetical protein